MSGILLIDNEWQKAVGAFDFAVRKNARPSWGPLDVALNMRDGLDALREKRHELVLLESRCSPERPKDEKRSHLIVGHPDGTFSHHIQAFTGEDAFTLDLFRDAYEFLAELASASPASHFIVCRHGKGGISKVERAEYAKYPQVIDTYGGGIGGSRKSTDRLLETIRKLMGQ